MPKTVERHLGIFTRLLRIEQHILDIISDKNPELVPVVKDFKDDLTHLLIEYEYNRIPKFIDKTQQIRSHGKTEFIKEFSEKTDNSNRTKKLKRQVTVAKKENYKKYRPKKTLPFPEESHRAEANLTKKQTKLRLEPELLKAISEISDKQGIPRNKWMTEAIEEKLKLEAPYLNLENIA